jgi:hypothetical protein
MQKKISFVVMGRGNRRVATMDGTIYMSADAGMKWKKQTVEID